MRLPRDKARFPLKGSNSNSENLSVSLSHFGTTDGRVYSRDRPPAPQQPGKVGIDAIDPLGEMVELNPNHADAPPRKEDSPAQPAAQQQQQQQQ